MARAFRIANCNLALNASAAIAPVSAGFMSKERTLVGSGNTSMLGSAGSTPVCAAS